MPILWLEQYPKGLGPIISEVADLLIQDVRQTNGRIDDLCTETNESIDDLAKQLDSRYAWLMAMLIACTSILITTMGAAVAVLKFSFRSVLKTLGAVLCVQESPHWIPACAGMTAYRPKAGFQTAS